MPQTELLTNLVIELPKVVDNVILANIMGGEVILGALKELLLLLISGELLNELLSRDEAPDTLLTNTELNKEVIGRRAKNDLLVVEVVGDLLDVVLGESIHLENELGGLVLILGILLVVLGKVGIKVNDVARVITELVAKGGFANGANNTGHLVASDTSDHINETENCQRKNAVGD